MTKSAYGWEKKCGCGTSYDEAGWLALRLYHSGRTDPSDWLFGLVLRDCSACLSTISVSVQQEDRAIYLLQF